MSALRLLHHTQWLGCDRWYANLNKWVAEGNYAIDMYQSEVREYDAAVAKMGWIQQKLRVEDFLMDYVTYNSNQWYPGFLMPMSGWVSKRRLEEQFLFFMPVYQNRYLEHNHRVVIEKEHFFFLCSTKAFATEFKLKWG